MIAVFKCDYPENYGHVNRFMTQQKWFKKLSTVMFILIADVWNYLTNRREAVTHFMITDDIKKSNEQVTFFIDYILRYYNEKLRSQNRGPIQHLHLVTDNCGFQFKCRNHFGWMADYVEEDHGLMTMQHGYNAEMHGKGMVDEEGGSGKTKGTQASMYGEQIENAKDLYLFLKKHHCEVTSNRHETLHQITRREFHYFPKGTFLSYQPREVDRLSAVKCYYQYGVRRTGVADAPRSIFQRLHFCPCPNCTTGNRFC